jgi:hypothetical protein
MVMMVSLLRQTAAARAKIALVNLGVPDVMRRDGGWLESRARRGRSSSCSALMIPAAPDPRALACAVYSLQCSIAAIGAASSSSVMGDPTGL